MSLADALEAAASELPDHADAIRPANGDPYRLLGELGAGARTAVLRWLLGHRPEDAAELLEAWAAEEPGAAAIGALDEEGLPKPGRKLLRRVRHGLRSRGVELPEAPARTVVASLPSVAEDFGSAWVSALDPAGGRVVYLVEANPSGGARLFEVLVDDARGIVRFEVYTAPRKRTRAFLDHLRGGDGGLAMVEVEPDAARAVIAHAAARQPAERPPPRAFVEWRARLTGAPGTAGGEAGAAPSLPGRLVREALGDGGEDAKADLERAAGLVREGRVGPWPDAEALDAVVARLRETLDARVIVSGATKQDQIESILREARDELFTGPGAALAAHRLRETAFVLWRTGAPADARACLTAAAAFEGGEPATNPVARALVDVPLAPVVERLLRGPEGDRGHEGPAEAGDGGNESGLLVTPDRG